MALARCQAKMYDHRCEVWRRVNAAMGANGRPVNPATRWLLLAVDVPCHFETGKGMSVPKEIGRADYDIVVTSDEVHFGADADVNDTDVLKNTTTGDLRAGLYWSVQGEPQKVGSIGRRYAGRQTVTAARLQAPPQGVG